ncbi:hypothetical protein KAR10_07545, partial [bacterium]|nr:hypothetical protein [bacterium]
EYLAAGLAELEAKLIEIRHMLHASLIENVNEQLKEMGLAMVESQKHENGREERIAKLSSQEVALELEVDTLKGEHNTAKKEVDELPDSATLKELEKGKNVLEKKKRLLLSMIKYSEEIIQVVTGTELLDNDTVLKNKMLDLLNAGQGSDKEMLPAMIELLENELASLATDLKNKKRDIESTKKRLEPYIATRDKSNAKRVKQHIILRKAHYRLGWEQDPESKINKTIAMLSDYVGDKNACISPGYRYTKALSKYLLARNSIAASIVGVYLIGCMVFWPIAIILAPIMFYCLWPPAHKLAYTFFGTREKPGHKTLNYAELKEYFRQYHLENEENVKQEKYRMLFELTTINDDHEGLKDTIKFMEKNLQEMGAFLKEYGDHCQIIYSYNSGTFKMPVEDEIKALEEFQKKAKKVGVDFIFLHVSQKGFGKKVGDMMALEQFLTQGYTSVKEQGLYTEKLKFESSREEGANIIDYAFGDFQSALSINPDQAAKGLTEALVLSARESAKKDGKIFTEEQVREITESVNDMKPEMIIEKAITSGVDLNLNEAAQPELAMVMDNKNFVYPGEIEKALRLMLHPANRHVNMLSPNILLENPEELTPLGSIGDKLDSPLFNVLKQARVVNINDEMAARLPMVNYASAFFGKGMKRIKEHNRLFEYELLNVDYLLSHDWQESVFTYCEMAVGAGNFKINTKRAITSAGKKELWLKCRTGPAKEIYKLVCQDGGKYILSRYTQGVWAEEREFSVDETKSTEEQDEEVYQVVASLLKNDFNVGERDLLSFQGGLVRDIRWIRGDLQMLDTFEPYKKNLFPAAQLHLTQLQRRIYADLMFAAYLFITILPGLVIGLLPLTIAGFLIPADIIYIPPYTLVPWIMGGVFFIIMAGIIGVDKYWAPFKLQLQEAGNAIQAKSTKELYFSLFLPKLIVRVIWKGTVDVFITTNIFLMRLVIANILIYQAKKAHNKRMPFDWGDFSNTTIVMKEIYESWPSLSENLKFFKWVWINGIVLVLLLITLTITGATGPSYYRLFIFGPLMSFLLGPLIAAWSGKARVVDGKEKDRLKRIRSWLEEIKTKLSPAQPKPKRDEASSRQGVRSWSFLPAIPLGALFFQSPLVFLIPLLLGIAAGIIICLDTYSDLKELIQEIKESISQKSMTLKSWDIFIVSSVSWFLALMATWMTSGDFTANSWLFGFFNFSFLLGLVLGVVLYTQKRFWQSKTEEFTANKELAAKRKLAKQACEEKNLEVLMELLGDYSIQDYVAKLLAPIGETSRTELIHLLKNYERVNKLSGRAQIIGVAKALRNMNWKPANQSEEAYLLIAEELAKKDKIREKQDWQSLIELGPQAWEPLQELLDQLEPTVWEDWEGNDGYTQQREDPNPEYIRVRAAIAKIHSTDSGNLKRNWEDRDKNLKKRDVSQKTVDSAVKLAIDNGEAVGINIKPEELRDLSPAGMAKLFEGNNNDGATRLTSVFQYSSDDARIKARDKLAQYLARSPDSENELKSALEMIFTNIKDSSLTQTSRLVILLSENDIFSQGQVLAHSGKKSIYIHINVLQAAQDLGMNEIIKTIFEHEDRDLARGYHADDIPDKDFVQVREIWEKVREVQAIRELADEYGLLEAPILPMKGGDISYWADQKLPESELRIKFHARQIIIQIAVETGYSLPTQGDLSYWAEKLEMVFNLESSKAQMINEIREEFKQGSRDAIEVSEAVSMASRVGFGDLRREYSCLGSLLGTGLFLAIAVTIIYAKAA